jgi:predicted nucleic acid-binding protein
MKNITLSADESLIEAARERARADQTTLNKAFRVWLTEDLQHGQRIEGLTVENPFLQ